MIKNIKKYDKYLSFIIHLSILYVSVKIKIDNKIINL